MPMRILHAANELGQGPRKVCLAIGFFDGVHLGHQQILRQTLTDARQHNGLAVVITFDQHPNTVVAPHRVPPLIYSLPKKLRVIESLGTDALLLIHFDKVFSRLSAEEFIRTLTREFAPTRCICVGANFLFGHRRTGNVDLLRALGKELGFTVHGLASVSLDGKAVSSTRIRERILAGDLDAVSQMLGRSYALCGKVVHGEGLGRQLGFPTANIDCARLALPPGGVYAVQVQVEGRTYPGVLNIGTRPTIQQPVPQLRVEAHLLDFSGDLYDQEVEIAFVEKLRDEQKFASTLELRAQIARDILEAKAKL